MATHRPTHCGPSQDRLGTGWVEIEGGRDVKEATGARSRREAHSLSANRSIEARASPADRTTDGWQRGSSTRSFNTAHLQYSAGWQTVFRPRAADELRGRVSSHQSRSKERRLSVATKKTTAPLADAAVQS